MAWFSSIALLVLAQLSALSTCRLAQTAKMPSTASTNAAVSIERTSHLWGWGGGGADAGIGPTVAHRGVLGKAARPPLRERLHDRGQLVSAIHTVAVGGSMIDPKIVEPLLASRTSGERSALADLTHREREVLAQIAQGKSNAAIAESLVLTKRAVEKHINAIFMKLGLAEAEDVSKRVKATLVYLAEAERRTD